jgi:hypothetical protein
MRERGLARGGGREEAEKKKICATSATWKARFELSPKGFSRRPDGPFEGRRGLSECLESWAKRLESSERLVV